jgi:hypothetical protein
MVMVSACGTGEQPQTPQPRDGRAGLQLSGTVAGSQVAVSDGSPDLIVGDCDVVGGAARDVCVVSRDLRGGPVTLAVRNPDVLVEGETVPVEDSGCAGAACDDVTGGAVVDVLVGEDYEHRAEGGTLTLDTVDEPRHYAGRLRLHLPDGVLSGRFDVVPRPD